MPRLLITAFLFCLLAAQPVRAEGDGDAPDVYRGHGIAMHGKPKYPANFTHFSYVNPDAPKGGSLWLGTVGTFDTLNPFTVKGNPEANISTYVYGHLMARALDEPFSYYPWIAEKIEYPKDRSWIAFTLNPKAQFRDGSPITVEDVIFSMNVLRKNGRPIYRYYYGDVVKMEKTGPRTVKFIFRNNKNKELPLIIAGDLPILSKKFWTGKDFTKPSLVKPLGSGPYSLKSFTPGRRAIYQRVKNYWAANLPALKGQFNFDTVRIEYFRDGTVLREALKAGEYDYRAENSASAWATAYNIAAVREGRLIKKKIFHKIPSGLQGFIMNSRKPIFKDWRVRRALVYAHDVQWLNQFLAYGQYTHSRSYFGNSELESRKGVPKGPVLELLKSLKEKFPESVPKRVFTTPYTVPHYKKSNIRPGLRKAFKLLKEAGWVVRNLKLVNAKTGKPFRFEFLIGSPSATRLILPFKRNLSRLGIDMRIRLVDQSQYVARIQKFDFDMAWLVLGQSSSPGNEQRIYFSSVSAKRPGSRNYAGFQNKAIDALVEMIISAPDRKSLVIRTRALDRMLLSMHMIIPNWHASFSRMVYWNKFGLPKGTKRYGIPVDTWWYDPKKAAKLRGLISSVPK